MSFLDEVDSLRSKLGFSRVNPVALVGIAFVSIAVIVLICLSAWGFFASPGVVVQRTDDSASTAEAESGTGETAVKHIFVHVVGSVQAPGMVELEAGQRVSDAVQAAGGFTPEADQLSVNLARQVEDGEQIVVGSVQESTGSSSSGQSSSSSEQSSETGTSAASGKVNINTATVEQLTTLKGVGEATAQKIIDYRQQNGSFKKIEDLKNVSGIGDKRYAALKDSITV